MLVLLSGGNVENQVTFMYNLKEEISDLFTFLYSSLALIGIIRRSAIVFFFFFNTDNDHKR